MVDWAAMGVAVAAAGTVSSAIGYAVRYVIRAEVRQGRVKTNTEVARIDGRINAHEAGCTERHTAIQRQLESLEHRGERIEDKLDRVLEASV